MRSYPTSHPEVNATLDALLTGARSVLGERFAGLYLYGSLASGGFDPQRSDIDFVVATNGPLGAEVISGLEAMHTRLWRSGLKWAGKLEGAYVPLALLQRDDPSSPVCPYVNESRFYLTPLGEDWVIQRDVLRKHGICVAGPDLYPLIDPVTPEDVRRAVLGTLRDWWRPMLERPDPRLAGGEYQAYAVMTMCRSLHTLETGVIGSKPEAARWAQEAMPGRWQPLIAWAEKWRPGARGDHFVPVLDFIRYTVETSAPRPAPSALTGLQVVAVNHAGASPAEPGYFPLAAYASAGVYAASGSPYLVASPEMPVSSIGEDDDESRLGAINGVIASMVATGRREGRAVLLAGGNCHHATGVLGGLQDSDGASARIGLVWFDAHGDFNTPHITLSGMLGGMPLAVCAGLALPRWREGAHIAAPLPTDRIILVGARNLDPAEEALLRATDVTLAAPAPGFPGADLTQAVADLAARVDLIYLHIDADILDARLQPNHRTVEPHGPDLAQTLDAVETVMSTGKVVAYAVVSVYARGNGADVSVASGIELLRGGLEAWQRHGMARPSHADPGADLVHSAGRHSGTRISE